MNEFYKLFQNCHSAIQFINSLKFFFEFQLIYLHSIYNNKNFQNMYVEIFNYNKI